MSYALKKRVEYVNLRVISSLLRGVSNSESGTVNFAKSYAGSGTKSARVICVYVLFHSSGVVMAPQLGTDITG